MKTEVFNVSDFVTHRYSLDKTITDTELFYLRTNEPANVASVQRDVANEMARHLLKQGKFFTWEKSQADLMVRVRLDMIVLTPNELRTILENTFAKGVRSALTNGKL